MIAKRAHQHAAALYSLYMGLRRIMARSDEDDAQCHYHWQDKCTGILPD